METWKFSPDLDTPKSFQAFCLYRDLGPTRSLEDAYGLYKSCEGRKVPGFFRQWCVKGEWVQRAIDFDLESDRLRRERQSAESRSDYENRLEAIRSTAEHAALNRLAVSKIISLIGLKLSRAIQDGSESDITKDQIERLMMVAQLMRLDASSIESALKILDEALDIRDVLKRLKGDEES